MTFSKGDKVRCISDSDAEHYLVEGHIYPVMDAGQGWVDVNGGTWAPSRFEKVEPKPAVGPPFKPGDPVWIYPAEMDGKPAWAVQRRTDAPEPEDTDDVEPEPLKEAIKATENFVAAMQAWGETVRQAAEKFGRDLLRGITSEPARCTSLLMVDKTTNIRQCTRDDDGHDNHVAYGASWKDAEEYGRVEVRS